MSTTREQAVAWFTKEQLEALEADGYERTADMIRVLLATEQRALPTRKDIALFILRTIGEYPAEFFVAHGVDAYRQLANGIYKMFVKEEGVK